MSTPRPSSSDRPSTSSCSRTRRRSTTPSTTARSPTISASASTSDAFRGAGGRNGPPQKAVPSASAFGRRAVLPGAEPWYWLGMERRHLQDRPMTSPSPVPEDRRQHAARWFSELRDRLCAEFERIEDEHAGQLSDRPAGRFERQPWDRPGGGGGVMRSEEHTSELQSLMR